MKARDCLCPSHGVLEFNRYTAVQALSLDSVRQLAAVALALYVGELNLTQAQALVHGAMHPEEEIAVSAAAREYGRRP